MTEKKLLRAGIIGAGFAARFHFDALQYVSGTRVEVTGAWSPTPAHLQAFTEARSLRAFHDLPSLLEQCDVLHVCTPPMTHEPLVKAILAMDKHAIVEKPFTGYFGQDD